MVLTGTVIIGQVISAGGMARLLKFTWIESLTVGVGMCGRAGMAFILAAIGLSMGVIDNTIFTVLIATTFLLNLLTSGGLKACSVTLEKNKRETSSTTVNGSG
ncbi:MAG: cation:proton antiporter [Gammaproteobacteria bacterium]